MDKNCASCTYLDLRDGNCYGKYYCNRKYERHLATDPACGSYTKAYSRSSSTIRNAIDFSNSKNSSSCYITTMLCDILKLNDSNYYLNTLRKFRDNYLTKNNKYREILAEYDVIGPIICEYLINDKQNKLIAAKTFFNYIKPIVSLINENMYTDAINLYKLMVNRLKKMYSISSIIEQNIIENMDIKNSGHGVYVKA